MKHMIKNVGAIFIIILLLPYVITTFFAGGLEFQEDVTEEQVTSEQSEILSVQESDGVVDMTLQDYLVGVVASEIPVSYEEEALKAQAVIARTTIRKALKDNPNAVLDATEGYYSIAQMKECWGSDQFVGNYEKLEGAVEDTINETVTYNGNYIEAAFHAVSCGMTRSGEEALQSTDYPYLVSVSCEDDKKSEDYLQSVTYTYEELGEICDVSDLNKMPKITEADSATYALKVNVGNALMTGEEFRETLNLASSSMILTEVEGKIKIVTKGMGHGLGLSQYEANEMAKQGSTYKDILNYFYKNIEITNE